MPKGSLESQLNQAPEIFFELKSLSYSAHELNTVINRFDQSKPKFFYPQLIGLLNATLNFLAGTNPESNLRRATNTHEDINRKFSQMTAALNDAKLFCQTLNENDQKVFNQAISYCKKCMLKQAKEFVYDTLLFTVWNDSKLKTLIENI